jgi:hypothetical protein
VRRIEVIMDDLRINLLDAAEACFELNPCPKIERWWCNIWCNTEPKKGVVQHRCNNKNTTKRYKTEQNKNSGEPHK